MSPMEIESTEIASPGEKARFLGDRSQRERAGERNPLGNGRVSISTGGYHIPREEGVEKRGGEIGVRR